ncbi:phage holin family protein [Allofournierella sp.]|uniref:phage holin family protein n=1 Tax=Allofournierella sp. TaxID=1940256 RepID=UPI003AF0C735
MDINIMGITSVAGITVCCYLLALAVKQTPLANKWLPTLCGLMGGLLGVAGMYTMPEFPAGDVITALAVGIVSGLAATGADQIAKQLHK